MSLAGPRLVIVATYGVLAVPLDGLIPTVTPLPTTLTGTVTTLRTAKLATRLTPMFCVPVLALAGSARVTKKSVDWPG